MIDQSQLLHMVNVCTCMTSYRAGQPRLYLYPAACLSRTR
uniref:Uncharacterized protein n=1 Tax=Arundo donax TaxID=35708 RepID=A0A0A9B0V7_ARUDO